MKTAPKQTSGYTIIELMMVVSLSAIVAVAVFSSYVLITRYTHRHTQKASEVQEMIVLRKTMRSVLENSNVESVSSDGITFVPENRDTLQTLFLKEGCLMAGAASLICGIREVNFNVSSGEAERFLFWEIETFKGGWIGGAVGVGF